MSHILTFLFSFAFTVPLVLKRIVEEKQQVGKFLILSSSYILVIFSTDICSGCQRVDEDDGLAKLVALGGLVRHHHPHHPSHHLRDGHRPRRVGDLPQDQRPHPLHHHLPL